MKKEERSYKMFLDDIQTAMSRIAEYIEVYDFEHFKRDYKTVEAFIRNFEIIGYASKTLAEKIKEKYPDVPWKKNY